jgi:hypothetical protein
MAETSLWGRLHRHLGPYGRLIRIENRVETGMPDVYYCLRGATGWLELKQLPAWPKRAGTPIRIGHLTREQVIWLEAERANGGAAHLLLQVGRDILLLDPSAVRDLFTRALTREHLRHRAVVGHEGPFPTIPLVRYLIAGRGASGAPKGATLGVFRGKPPTPVA